ncbi:MAG: VgrG-related protein [Actinobacteria bacterium]|nr:VgrG-related protein [Actinomycetota bacterium]
MALLGNSYDSPGGNLRMLWDRSHITDEEQAQIARVSVEAQLGIPRMCEVEIKGGPKKIAGFGGVRSQIGKTISVFGYGLGNLTGDIVFRGTIASRELRTDPGQGARMVLRAYDGGYEMMAARKTRSFKDMSYGEIAKKIARDYTLDGLIGSDISTSGTSHPFVVQSNESDWDFLARLAREQGWVMFVRVYTQLTFGRTQLFFGPPKKASGVVSSDTKFKAGDRRLRSIRGSVISIGIPKSVAVPGWDDRKGDAARGSDSIGSRDLVTANTKFRPSKKAGSVTSLETFAGTKARADRAAKGTAARIAGASVDIDMIVRGNPLVKLNRLIQLTDLGDVSGIHTVSGVVHVFDPSAGGFSTQILCTGLDDRSLGGLMGAGKPAEKLHGVYPAVVSDIKDPQNLGRVKLALPWLSKDYVTDWSRIIQLGAGKDVGLQMLPRPKEEVVVAFENGQLDSPIILGSVFGKTTGKIPNSKLVKNGKPLITALTTKAGHQLIFDDDNDSSSITLQMKNGSACSVVMTDKGGITITTKGDRSVTIKSSQNVIVEAEKNAKVSANDVTIDSKGPIKIQGKGKLDISAPNVGITAQSALKLKGTNVSIDATASLALKSSGTTSVKGAVVKLN